MEKCEAYTSKKAFDTEYDGLADMTLCEIDVCPYNNKGETINCIDNIPRTACKNNGNVERADKFVNIEGRLFPKSQSTGCLINL